MSDVDYFLPHCRSSSVHRAGHTSAKDVLLLQNFDDIAVGLAATLIEHSFPKATVLPASRQCVKSIIILLISVLQYTVEE